MNIKNILTGIAFLIIAVFSIASSSIAVECYNTDEKGTELKAKKETNFNFLVFHIVGSIILVLISFLLIFIGIKF
jgi:hypothetical protein